MKRIKRNSMMMFLCSSLFVGLTGNISGNENPLAAAYTKTYVTCLPSSTEQNRELEEEMKLALRQEAPWVRDLTIERIIIIEDWRVQRDEFTTLVRYRTRKALTVLQKGDENYS